MSVALSHPSVYSSGSNCWCSLKSYLISVSHSLCEKLARWLLQDRECFETAQRAVNLSFLHAFFPAPFTPPPAPPPLQTQMGATVMLLARSRTQNGSVIQRWWQGDSELQMEEVLTSVIPVRPLQSWVSLEGIITLLSCCYFFFFSHFFPSSFWPSQAVCWNIVFLLERLRFITGNP